ncbi:MAG: helix-turn-helix domain-containing protein [Nocardioides sp.]
MTNGENRSNTPNRPHPAISPTHTDSASASPHDQTLVIQQWTGTEARQLRAALRLSMEGFAEKLGVSPRTVTRWEGRGETLIPRPETQAMLDTMLSRASVGERGRFGRGVELSVLARAEMPMAPKPGHQGLFDTSTGEGLFALDQAATDGMADEVSVRSVVTTAAGASAQFGQWADSLGIGDLALATLWARLGQLAVDYVYAPMVPVVRDLKRLRDEVFALLVSPDPAQAPSLYLLAGTACGLLAHASGNLGYLGPAKVQASAALVCARKADSPMLAAWVIGVRALQSEWSGNEIAALKLIDEARVQVDREQDLGTAAAWLAAIEARAHARSGRSHNAALSALKRAADHRVRIAERASDPNQLDSIGGILTFTKPKQHYYAATTYRRIGNYRAAAAEAEAAIAAYEEGPIEQRSYGDISIAWADLAIARASGQKADLDNAAEALGAIERQAPEHRLPPLLGPLTELRSVLSESRTHNSKSAIAMRDTITDLIGACQRPVTESSS